MTSFRRSGLYCDGSDVTDRFLYVLLSGFHTHAEEAIGKEGSGSKIVTEKQHIFNMNSIRQRKLLVKVIDIFGNDMMTILEVSV